MRDLSPLHKARLAYQPKLAGALQEGIKNVKVTYGEKTTAVKDKDEIQNLFKDVYGGPIASFSKSGEALNNEPKNVGVILLQVCMTQLNRLTPAINYTAF